MKLYVWHGEGVLQNYTSGIVVVLAASAEEAWKVLEAEDHTAAWCLRGCDGGNTQIDPEEFDLDTARAFVCWGGS